jgi:hypothetical protein
VFDNRCPQAHALQVFFSHLPHRYFQKICDYLSFRLSDPDVPFARPGAASPALHTFKMQTSNVPRIFLNHRFHRLTLKDQKSRLYHHFRTAPVSALVAIEAYFARQPFVIHGFS